jgi:hypothetical protein
MDGTVEPKREGLTRHETVLDENGFITKYALQCGQAKSLVEMADEYAFFTPAILYLYARFHDAPLADFVYMERPSCRFYFKKFDKPIFKGLEARSNKDPAWNFALWAVKREHWALLCNWLVSITLTNRDTKAVCGIGEQKVTVIDPLAADTTSVWHDRMPRIEVTSFGINGNKYRAALAQGKGPYDAPVLTFDQPDKAMLAFANALYGGANPVDARTLHNHRSKERTDEG